MKVKTFLQNFVSSNVPHFVSVDDNLTTDGKVVASHVTIDVLNALDARDMPSDLHLVHKLVVASLNDLGVAHV